MCSRRFASLGEGGRKAEWDPPGLFYSLPRRKASKNDAKPGHCVAIALWTYGIWGAISFLDCERRPSESLKSINRRFESSCADPAAALCETRFPGDFSWSRRHEPSPWVETQIGEARFRLAPARAGRRSARLSSRPSETYRPPVAPAPERSAKPPEATGFSGDHAQE
jgi:hypothetical protein